MRFLADESCDFAVVHALRANGNDVLAVSEIAPTIHFTKLKWHPQKSWTNPNRTPHGT